jgi:hypothetical protein
MKKALFTMAIENYAPEICEITHALFQGYASKIGADFYVITERRFPEMPWMYEKFQVYDLAREMGLEWAIFFDGDALVHPDLMDMTVHLPKDTVMQNGRDVSSNRFTPSIYALRDGRFIGSCNWMSVVSEWCLDFWHPLEGMTLAEALSNIHPIVMETRDGIDAAHLIDDYLVTQNIARYGLKHTTFQDLRKTKPMGDQEFGYLFHTYRMSNEKKLAQMRVVLADWGLGDMVTQTK